jgi:hypothetical protein
LPVLAGRTRFSKYFRRNRRMSEPHRGIWTEVPPFENSERQISRSHHGPVWFYKPKPGRPHFTIFTVQMFRAVAITTANTASQNTRTHAQMAQNRSAPAR